ncbi:MAG: DNA polymerase I [Planctomycetes bacterium]|nr:DNA polymerase I [Planctomycetota bacterium]
MPKSLYIIDGHYQIYRAFYGLSQPLMSPSGEPTNATHTFCSMLFSLIKTRKPDYLAMVADVSDETVFRRDLDPNYKAHRDPAPEGLHIQAERIFSIVEALRIPVFRVPGMEADDLMATIAEKMRDQDIEVFLVSRDKDLDQLLTDHVRLFDPVKQIVIDPATLFEQKGYTPKQAVEIQTLIGDSTDNIPGVPGVGPKTAVKLIAEYGSADAVIANAEKQSAKLAEKLKGFRDQLPITRQLVTLRRDVPLDFDLQACAIENLNAPSAISIFHMLGFSRLVDTLNSLVSNSAPKPRTSPAPEKQAQTTFASIVDTELPIERITAVTEIAVEKKAPANYVLVDTPEKLNEFAIQLRNQPEFAFDTETTGLSAVDSDIVGLSFAWKPGEAYYLPIRGMGPTLAESLVVQTLKPVFENVAIAKSGQNMKFDALVVRQLGIKVANMAFDTLIASFVLDPSGRSHSLDALAKSLLNHEMIPITDLIGKGRDQITMDHVDTRQVCEYAAEDADYTWRLKEFFEPQIRGSEVEALFRETEMPLVEVLVEMENNGVCLDRSVLAALGNKMGNRLLEISRQVHQAVGHSFNLDSPKQLATVLFDELGFEVARTTKTGRSTDAETLEQIASQTEHPVPRLLLEHRELSKLKGTYVDTLPTMISRRTGRIHAGFHQTGAVTGRLSSSDPNLQNIPIRTDLGKRIREAFIACDEDHVLLTADYSQIELRLLAHFSQDAALLEAFRTGQDIHRAVAAQINGVKLEDVNDAQRSAAKAVNFGIIYGQSAFGLSRAIGISRTQAKVFIETYFARYPGIRKFIDRCIAEAREKGFARTILGRRRPIPELLSRNQGQVAFGERIAVNTVVQGSAADLIKRAMIDIHRELKSGQYSAKMLIQVHDELVFEVRKINLDAAVAMIRERMEHALPLDVPITVDLGWGRNWATI